ncbi:CCHC-type domain-containing protein [Trichonephila inaurata madagascariensis]|uniref:CCHC-type domain-containing protein n=1 Tax=Trichonephila inaurata madagascariensis TaxID=2747483 RepID=A0A8X6XM47_9ARAC|nr:CCHC-type domain-containing protein [Trichonephila inaurata madagascariensis]
MKEISNEEIEILQCIFKLMTTWIPGIVLQQFQVKNKIFYIWSFVITCRVGLRNKQMPYFSSVSDEWNRDLKTTKEIPVVFKYRNSVHVESVDGKLVHALVDSGTEITVIKKDLVPGISVEGASTIYLKGIFGPAVKCPLVYVPIGLATGGQVNVVHQQVLCALAEVLVEDVLLPPDVLDMLGGAQSEENSLAQSSQDLRVDSGNVDETEVSSGILPEKAQENVEDGQRNITSCQNEVGTFGTKDEEVTAEMDKGSMVADSFRSEQECCADLALAWKHAKEGSTACTWQQVERYTRDLAAGLLYTEEDLATTGETRPEEIERGEVEKRKAKKTWSDEGRRLDDGL